MSTTYRDASGRSHDRPAPDRAEVHQFRDAGTVWDEITPPAGFLPTKATDEELAAFGFAPRPSSGAPRRDWDAAFANYRGVATAGGPRCAPSPNLRFGAATSPGSPSPAGVAGDPADPHSLGPVNNLSEARARFNPNNDPSTVITDNGDGTYKIVRTFRSAPH